MMPTPSELKARLLSEGFEIYRVRGTDIVLAERVRDNLILDSGVSARPGEELRVRFVARTQASDFPSESVPALLTRARRWVASAVEQGYREVSTASIPIQDPNDPAHTLDTWYEVAFEKLVPDWRELVSELRYALGLDKIVSPDAEAV